MLWDQTKEYRPTEAEPFMNERQKEYFHQKLLRWKEEILRESRENSPPFANRKRKSS